MNTSEESDSVSELLFPELLARAFFPFLFKEFEVCDGIDEDDEEIFLLMVAVFLEIPLSLSSGTFTKSSAYLKINSTRII